MMAEPGSEAGTEVETSGTVDPKDSGYLNWFERPTMAGVERQAMAELPATAQRCCGWTVRMQRGPATAGFESFLLKRTVWVGLVARQSWTGC
jgi:hypothetical protein